MDLVIRRTSSLALKERKKEKGKVEKKMQDMFRHVVGSGVWMLQTVGNTGQKLVKGSELEIGRPGDSPYFLVLKVHHSGKPLSLRQTGTVGYSGWRHVFES
jgi:hypothetical protein